MAYSAVLPRRVVADSSVLSAVTLNGADDDGKPYVFTFFSSGGMGARASKDGLSARVVIVSRAANVGGVGSVVQAERAMQTTAIVVPIRG